MNSAISNLYLNSFYKLILMSILTITFVFKIFISLIFVALPMLVLPEKKIQALMKLPVSNVIVYRLYGMAILALLVGYGSGLMSALEGQFNPGVVLMGIVSNIGASVIMLSTGYWKMQRALWAFFTTIGLLLLTSFIFTDQMLAPLI